MPIPNINAHGASILVPSASEIEEIGRGGQKRVFKAKIEGKYEALKFLLITPDEIAAGGDIGPVQARAEREVAIMRDCQSDFLVKLGSVDIAIAEYNGETLLYFSEELIDGVSLADLLSTTQLDVVSTIRLGIQIGNAIAELGAIGKIHRDIKPGNIMMRQSGDFVLLDAGLAFDILGESISVGVVGTFAYCSPEQFDFSARRSLDSRSDQFSLGVTMYYCCTGRHPFWRRGINESQIFSAILRHQPPPPSDLSPAVPPELDEVILRLLGKSPHLRYRRTEQLVQALETMRN